MRKVVVLIGAVLLPGVIVAGAGGGCDTTDDGVISNCIGTPNADAGSNTICDISWSCDSGNESFELSCTFSQGNYLCTCFSAATTAKTFSVDPFNCDSLTGITNANAGCNWVLAPPATN
jgi:hypothetical protein